jgi:hypothetical protein
VLIGFPGPPANIPAKHLIFLRYYSVIRPAGFRDARQPKPNSVAERKSPSIPTSPARIADARRTKARLIDEDTLAEVANTAGVSFNFEGLDIPRRRRAHRSPCAHLRSTRPRTAKRRPDWTTGRRSPVHPRPSRTPGPAPVLSASVHARFNCAQGGRRRQPKLIPIHRRFLSEVVNRKRLLTPTLSWVWALAQHTV